MRAGGKWIALSAVILLMEATLSRGLRKMVEMSQRIEQQRLCLENEFSGRSRTDRQLAVVQNVLQHRDAQLAVANAELEAVKKQLEETRAAHAHEIISTNERLKTAEAALEAAESQLTEMKHKQTAQTDLAAPVQLSPLVVVEQVERVRRVVRGYIMRKRLKELLLLSKQLKVPQMSAISEAAQVLRQFAHTESLYVGMLRGLVDGFFPVISAYAHDAHDRAMLTEVSAAAECVLTLHAQIADRATCMADSMPPTALAELLSLVAEALESYPPYLIHVTAVSDVTNALCTSDAQCELAVDRVLREMGDQQGQLVSIQACLFQPIQRIAGYLQLSTALRMLMQPTEARNRDSLTACHPGTLHVVYDPDSEQSGESASLEVLYEYWDCCDADNGSIGCQSNSELTVEQFNSIEPSAIADQKLQFAKQLCDYKVQCYEGVSSLVDALAQNASGLSREMQTNMRRALDKTRYVGQRVVHQSSILGTPSGSAEPVPGFIWVLEDVLFIASCLPITVDTEYVEAARRRGIQMPVDGRLRHIVPREGLVCEQYQGAADECCSMFLLEHAELGNAGMILQVESDEQCAQMVQMLGAR